MLVLINQHQWWYGHYRYLDWSAHPLRSRGLAAPLLHLCFLNDLVYTQQMLNSNLWGSKIKGSQGAPTSPCVLCVSVFHACKPVCLWHGIKLLCQSASSRGRSVNALSRVCCTVITVITTHYLPLTIVHCYLGWNMEVLRFNYNIKNNQMYAVQPNKPGGPPLFRIRSDVFSCN